MLVNKNIKGKSAYNLKVVTYNIQHARQLENISTILKKVGEDTDIICLQEVNHFEDKTKIKEEINKALSRYKNIYYNNVPSFGKYVGFATFWDASKLELIDSHYMLLPEFNESSPIHHKLLMSTKDSRRGALITTFALKDDKKLRVINLHLDWRGKYTHRLNQIKCIKDFTSSLEKVDFEIVCGDFNTIGPIWSLNKGKSKGRQDAVQSILGLEYNSTVPDETWTHDGLASVEPQLRFAALKKLLAKIGMHYYQKLDYIFVRDFEVIESEVMLAEGSDHYPVVAKLEFKKSKT